MFTNLYVIINLFLSISFLNNLYLKLKNMLKGYMKISRNLYDAPKLLQSIFLFFLNFKYQKVQKDLNYEGKFIFLVIIYK